MPSLKSAPSHMRKGSSMSTFCEQHQRRQPSLGAHRSNAYIRSAFELSSTYDCTALAFCTTVIYPCPVCSALALHLSSYLRSVIEREARGALNVKVPAISQ